MDQRRNGFNEVSQNAFQETASPQIMTFCSLLTTLDFNSVPSDPYSNLGGLNPEITRIKTLIEAIENYGVDKKYIFTVEDLFEKKHIPRVVRCLEEIEKLVQILCFVFLEKKCPNFTLFQARQEEHVNFASMPVNRVYY